MSRFITAFRTSSKTQSKLSQLPQQQHQQPTPSKGYKLRPKPQQLPFEFVFIPELYGLPSTYQYQYATRSESHPELAFANPPSANPPHSLASIATHSLPLSPADDSSSIASSSGDSVIVGADDIGESKDGIKSLPQLSKAISTHSTGSNSSKQPTPALSTSSNQPQQTQLTSPIQTNLISPIQTEPQTTASLTNQPPPSSSTTTTTTTTQTNNQNPKEKKNQSESGVGKLISTYSTLKEKLLYFRDQESKLLQQAGAHSSVAQSEDRKTIALSAIVHRVRQTRKLLLSRISQPRWEIPHHYHTTALEHSLGRKQPNVMEVGELINGHLRIYAIARRTTLSQKILIYALNRAKKAKTGNQERIKAITARLKEIRTKIKELEELVIQLRQKGVELLNAIAQIYYNAYYTTNDYLAQVDSTTGNPPNPITPKAIVLNNGQITTNLQQFITNIPYVQDKQRSELLKLAQLFSIDILTSSSSTTGGPADIRSRFLKSLHIAPGATTTDSGAENVELQLSQEDKNLVHDILRSVRDEMTSTSYSPQGNHSQEFTPTFAKDMVVGEAKLIMFPPSSTTAIAMTSNDIAASTQAKGDTQGSSHSPTSSIMIPGYSHSPPSSSSAFVSITGGPPGSNSQQQQSTTPPQAQAIPLSLSTNPSEQQSSTPPSPTFDPVTGEPLASLQLNQSQYAKKVNFTTVDVLPQPSLHTDNIDDDYEANLLSTGATTDREASFLNAKQSLVQDDPTSASTDHNSASQQRPSGATGISTQGVEIGDEVTSTVTEQAQVSTTSSSNQSLQPSTSPSGPQTAQTLTSPTASTSQQCKLNEDGKQENEQELGLLTRSVSDLLSISFDPSYHAEIISKALKKQQQLSQEAQLSGLQLPQVQETPAVTATDTSTQVSTTDPSTSQQQQQQPPPPQLGQKQLLTHQSQPSQPAQPQVRGSSQPKYKSHAPTSLYQVSSKTLQPSNSTTFDPTHHSHPSSYTSPSYASTFATEHTQTPPFSSSATPPQPSILSAPHTPPNQSHLYATSATSASSIPSSHTSTANQNQLQSSTTSLPPSLHPSTDSTLAKTGTTTSASPFNPSPTPGISVFGGGGLSGGGLVRKSTLLSSSLTTTTTSSSSIQTHPSSHQLASGTQLPLTSTHVNTTTSSTQPSTPSTASSSTATTNKLQPTTKPVVVRYGGLGSSTKVLSSTTPGVISVSTTSLTPAQPSTQQTQPFATTPTRNQPDQA